MLYSNVNYSKTFHFWTLDLRWKTNLSVSKLGWNKALESAKPSQRDLFQYGIVRSYNSVTRLGDLLHFGQHLMPLATIILPNLPTFLGNLCKGVKIFDFSSEIILGNIFLDIRQLLAGLTLILKFIYNIGSRCHV